MLLELHIQNLAVIEDAKIDFTPGLNAFTGQTGAGKSLVIGAFEILIGLRTAGDMLRPGAEHGQVTGLFEVSHRAIAEQVAEVLDQPAEDCEQLLIKRKLFASGRSSVSVNGLPATNPMIKRVGQLLVDIHGQHDHQHLLKPSNQLQIIDAFAKCTEDRKRFSETLTEVRELTRLREELSTGADLRRQQLELYEFQADEIDAAEPGEGEFPELQARSRVLASLQRIKQDAGSAHAALYEAEGSVSERLQVITHLLIELNELDPDLDDITEQVRTSTLALQEAAFELGRYVDRLEHDPGESAEVDERLNVLNRLVSKYGDGSKSDDPLGPVLAYRAEIGEKIGLLKGQDSDRSGIDERIDAGRVTLTEIAGKLTKSRKAAAKKVVPLVQSQLKELGMAEAVFEIGFEGLSLDDHPGSHGLDAVEMLVQTNPGQPMQPLRKIASGGEMSRIMLALKSVLAGSDRISVLVFDEIDANIGGRLGTVIGKKLQQLAGHRGAAVGKKPASKAGVTSGGISTGGKASGRGGQQVLCITHLPQIAAFADNHLRITKTVSGKGAGRQTSTTVSQIQGKTRVEELAEMMAGKEASATTRKQARELIDAAG